jgi:hypothetical protein
LEIKIGDNTVDQIVLLSPQLLTDAILGLEFLIDHEAEISFPDKRVSLKISEEFCTLEFLGAKEATQHGVAETALKEQVRNLALRSTLPSTTAHIPAESSTGEPQQLGHTLVAAGEKLGEASDSGIHTNIHQGDCLLSDDELPHCEDACDDTDFPMNCHVPSRKVRPRCSYALGLVEQGQVADVIGDFSCVEGKLDNLNDNCGSADCVRMCLSTHYLGPINATKSQRPKSDVNCTDDRDVTATQLRAKVCENNTLSPQQRGGTV